MKRKRNVKIVATLGPASDSYDMIRALHEAGADVFRLNMSHGSHEEIAKKHAIIRQVEKDTGSSIAILADLQGPKLRVGVFAGDSEMLEEGARFRLDLDTADGDSSRVCLPHPEIFAALEPGKSLLVNDGKIRLKVEECGSDFANCVVIAGGVISNRKGVNVPDVELPLAALSEKDRADLEFTAKLGVDWMALSFVQRPADVEEARALVKGRAAILSKIEKPNAVERFDAILAVSDGIMVARGDLGVELPVQNVPPIQKRLVRKCRNAAKPVIVATQMLESMIESPMPTRAEVSDVATAIYEGADAVMLSGDHDGQGCRRGRTGPDLYPDHRGQPHGQSQFGCGWHRRRRAGDRRNHQYQGDLLLYPKRDNGAAGGARTSARADHRPDPAGGNGPPPCLELGVPLRDHAGDGAVQGRGCQRRQGGPRRRLWHHRGPDRGHCRCAFQRHRNDQHSAGCAL